MPKKVQPWQITAFSAHAIRQGFDCGSQPLNKFLESYAGQHEGKDLRTYLALANAADSHKQVLGYCSICSFQIEFSSLPKTAYVGLSKHHPVPCVLIARLAVDLKTQGQGLGAHLLLHALHQAWKASKQVGIHLVVVHALDAQATAFYEKFGFQPLSQPNPQALFLPMATVAKLFAK
jgi:GNAT superfamily N-acetyltransferase